MLPRTINLPKTQSFFLFGARQTGKSTLVGEWLSKGAKSLTFNLLDGETLLELSRNPGQLVAQVAAKIEEQTGPFRVFIDEIQKLPELLNQVQQLLDRYPHLQVILTGSSARKLRRAGTNLGGGRLLQLSLFPLTWPELNGSLSLDLLMRFGSLPPIFNDLFGGNYSEEAQAAARRRLRSYVTIYLEEEIRNEGLVRSLGDFARFLEVVAQNNGGLVNYSNISREAQVARKTVEGYYQILQDTLIAHQLDPYESSIRKRIAQQPKVYLFDTGVVNAISHTLTAPLSPDRRGPLFENLCITEAFRLISYNESETKLYFWRTKDGAEVDLLAEKHGKLVAAFEFKSGKRPHITRKQLGSFLEIFPDVPFFLVTEDKNQMITDSTGNVFGTMITFSQYIDQLYIAMTGSDGGHHQVVPPRKFPRSLLSRPSRC